MTGSNIAVARGTARMAGLVAGVAAAMLLAACSPSSATTAPPQGAASPAPSGTAGSGAPPAASTSGTTGAIACTAPATPTVSETEGPYYKAGAPQSANLVTSGIAGTQLTYAGYVVDTACRPLANAKVEIWQANAAGVYDNSGYSLRGWVLTDPGGRFAFQTVIPGEYPGRTEHIHVKVTPQGGSTLTTQMYFPGQTSNEGDGIYDKSLLLTMAPSGAGFIGTFTFVLKT